MNQLSVPPGSILVCQWGYSMQLVDFYEVLKETGKTLLVKNIESKSLPTVGYLDGYAVPDKEKPVQYPETLRVFKRESKKQDGFYLISRKTGYKKYYHVWDGNPVYNNHCD